MNLSRKHKTCAAVGLVAILAGLTIWITRPTHGSSEELIRKASIALARGKFVEAEEFAIRVLRSEPESIPALLIAGDACDEMNQPNKALNYYSRIPPGDSDKVIDSKFRSAQLAVRLGDSVESEKYLREVLQYAPNHVEASESLSFYFRATGRQWEFRPFVIRRLRRNEANGDHLISMASDRLWLRDRERKVVEGIRTTDPNDPLPFMWQGCEWQRLGNHEGAREVFQMVVETYPEFIEAWARLGSNLFIAGTDQELLAWHQELPPEANDHPEVWHVRGLLQKKQGKYESAARCFWEALSRDPNHRAANYQLSQTLVELKRPEIADEFAKRAQLLSKLKMTAEAATGFQSAIPSVVDLLRSMGRNTEAVGWCHLIVKGQLAKRVEWAKDTIRELESELTADAPFVQLAFNLSKNHDLSDYPLPDWGTAEIRTDTVLPKSKKGSRVKFVNNATESGLKFSYFNGAKPNAERAYMFELSGGGVGIVDSNGDGWPDVYLTQGCAWPLDGNQIQYANRLFQNMGNGQFQDVTELAHIGDNGFGQGIAIADYNSDGFPDLYIANIGRNRLYENNGDGTFVLLHDDVVNDASVENCWTVSCALADLNGDGWPDIYDVNYLGGPDVFEKVCKNNGRPIQCFPTDFPGEQDRILLNQGDGSFQDATAESGIVFADGKGMGIVAADFDGTDQLSLMIANDTTPNFFFVNKTKPDGKLVLSNNALLAGLALDNNGFANSCMGLAVGDANADGLPDLFVTNFREEANNFFFQSPGNQFEDRIVQSNLHDPGFMYEGWGTQFLDGELDGLPDLVVANGHLDDYQPSQGKRMPAQYFQNLGDGQFHVAEAKSVGPYFSERHLGRAIARLDWDRDGREDFCVTHVDAPVALLSNRTQKTGHFLKVRLTGVTGSRDAIGAIVTVKSGASVWKRQLMAGDGFSASNERILVFGLGETESADSVTVIWPSGHQQEHLNPKIDSELMIVEAKPKAFTRPHSMP